MALSIQVTAIVFSLIGPVPIKQTDRKWTPQSVPSNWHLLKRRITRLRTRGKHILHHVWPKGKETRDA